MIKVKIINLWVDQRVKWNDCRNLETKKKKEKWREKLATRLLSVILGYLVCWSWHIYLSLKPGFHMSGKSQTIGDFSVSRLSQILSTNENSKSKISPIVWNGRGQIWRIESVSLFPTISGQIHRGNQRQNCWSQHSWTYGIVWIFDVCWRALGLWS